VKVVDLTSAVSGPYCTMILGDFGAEVIKVESPPAGDMNRMAGPFINGESAYFIYGNRNKKSLTLNLKKEAGRNILLSLVREADVFVENFRPAVKHRLGIDFETLSKLNPGLIYCSISGFGQEGPWADRPGFDQIAQGMSGLMSVTGTVETGPTRVGVAMGDSVCGVFAALGILAALEERRNSGRGQYLETSLLSGLVALLGFQAAKYFATGQTPLPQGNDHASFAPYGTYQTKDGQINIAVGSDQMWARLCQALDLGELEKDQRYASVPARVERKDELRRLMEARLAERTAEEWVDLLAGQGVASGPIYTIPQVFQDAQVLQQEMLLKAEHPKAGEIDLIGFPIKLSRTPCRVESPPPCLGQHTQEILNRLGFSDSEIEELRAEEAI